MISKSDTVLKFFQKSNLLKMNMPIYRKTVEELFLWLIKQDKITKDQTSFLLPKRVANARIICKNNIIVAGLEEVCEFFKKDIILKIKIPDGEKAKKDDIIVTLSGLSIRLLALERTILNILQRMSGIATQTNHFVEKIKGPSIAATRKTVWSLLDKKAVAVGGGLTHRLNLSDGILIKDNHLEIIKKEYGLINEDQAITKALIFVLKKRSMSFRAKRSEVEESNSWNNTDEIDPSTHSPTGEFGRDDSKNIEIEVNTPEGANAAVKIFSSIKTNCYLTVMFDNWQPSEVKNFIARQNIHENINRRMLFEASGNITEENIAEWGKTPVDFISMGSLTHSVKAADLSLEII